MFDKIFLFYSFEYIYEPQEYLKKLHSILKKMEKYISLLQIKMMY